MLSCFLPWTIKHPKIGPILLGEQILFDSIAKGVKYNDRVVSSESIHIHLIYCIAKSEDFDQTIYLLMVTVSTLLTTRLEYNTSIAFTKSWVYA